MQSALSLGTSNTRYLAPFALLSLLVHLVILFSISLPTPQHAFIQPRSMAVYFNDPSVSERSGISNKVQTVRINNLPELPDSSRTQAKSSIPGEDVPVFGDSPSVPNTQQLLETYKEIARDDARKAEQQIAMQEKLKRNTAVGWVERDLKQPQKEIHLANGMLKIITDWGAVCFQPVPYFARESAGVFGMPVTCP